MAEYKIWAVFLTHQECERLAHVLISKGWTVGPTATDNRLWEGEPERLGYVVALRVHPEPSEGQTAATVRQQIKQVCFDGRLLFLMLLVLNPEDGSSGWTSSILERPIEARSTVWERIE